MSLICETKQDVFHKDQRKRYSNNIEITDSYKPT
jgi:hypothetical protein